MNSSGIDQIIFDGGVVNKRTGDTTSTQRGRAGVDEIIFTDVEYLRHEGDVVDK